MDNYKDISNETLKAMSTFCKTTLEENNYTKRIKAATLIQRQFMKYYHSKRQTRKRQCRYNLRLRNFFEQGCSIAPLECAGNVPIISSFHRVHFLYNKMIIIISVYKVI